MKINTRSVYQMTPEGEFVLLEQDSFEYDGPIAECFGGKSKTKSETTQNVTTTNLGIQQEQGTAIAATGPVEINQQTTDLGAIQGAFDFAQHQSDVLGEFGHELATVAQTGIETSRQAIATVATGGQSDIAQSAYKYGAIALGIVAALVVGQSLIAKRA